MIENECKFRVVAVPNLAGCTSLAIEQWYFTDDLRVRLAAGRCYLTQKSAIDGDLTRRVENTVEITPAMAEALRPLARTVFNKTRYFVPLPGGLTAELDVFAPAGELLVEVEFPSDEARRIFIPPTWFGEQVIGRVRDVSDLSRLVTKRG